MSVCHWPDSVTMTPQQQASCQRVFRLRRNRDAHSKRAPLRLVTCVTDGSAVPFQAALATLIKGQRSTAPPWPLG